MKLELVNSIQAHNGSLTSLCTNKAFTHVITCGLDRNIKLYNVSTGALVRTYSGGHGFGISNVCVNHDSTQIASVGGDKVAFLWDVMSARIVRKLQGHTQRLNCVQYNADASVLVTGSYDKRVMCWDLRSNMRTPIQTFDEARDSITKVLLGKHEIMSASVDGCVRTYDLRNGTLRTDELFAPVCDLRLSNDENCMVVACLDDHIRLLDISSGELLNKYTGHEARQYRTPASLTPDDSMVLSGSENGEIVAWDLVDATVTSRTPAHKGGVTALESTKKANVTISGGNDGQLCVWQRK